MNLENTILAWQFIAVVMFVIALFLSIINHELRKNTNVYFKETVDVIEHSNKQKLEILNLRKSLKVKNEEFQLLQQKQEEDGKEKDY